MNILQYREHINTECSNHQDTILSKKAIKVDGNSSLKMALKCGDLKSCDYLKYKKEKIFMIEISDLNFQLKKLSIELNPITNSVNSLSKSTSKMLKPMNIIQKELKEKVTNSMLILNELVKYIHFMVTKTKVFIVALCTNSKSDIMIFDKIRKDLKRHLKILVDDIILLPTVELEKVL